MQLWTQGLSAHAARHGLIQEPPMTETDWLTCSDPIRMLEFVREAATARQLRLFQVACCRRIWQFVTDPDSRALVELIERAADSPLDMEAVRALPYDALTDDCGGPGPAERHAYMVAGHIGYCLIGPIHGSTFPSDDWQNAVSAANGAATVVAEAQRLPDGDEFLPAYQAHMAGEHAAQCDLLRDIIRHPNTQAEADALWRTADVVGLADAIYTDHVWDRLPILVDALMEAGCADSSVVTHCREGGPHVRGCWVLSLILQK
jgi:hypothetical protein